MNRAERRQQEREERKARKQGGQERRKHTPPSKPDADPCPNGHPEQSMAFALYGTPPHRCPRCGVTPQFGGIPGIRSLGVSPSLVSSAEPYFGLPERASRQWIVEHSDKVEGLGVVPIPVDKQDGLVTHAQYMVDCPHFDDDDGEQCSCEEDEAVEWELVEFQGG